MWVGGGGGNGILLEKKEKLKETKIEWILFYVCEMPLARHSLNLTFSLRTQNVQNENFFIMENLYIRA